MYRVLTNLFYKLTITSTITVTLYITVMPFFVAPRHYPQYVFVRSHGPDSVYVKWRGVTVGINEEVLIGYKVHLQKDTYNN